MPTAGDASSYKDALVLLGTAGVIVPLLGRLRISPILAFLAAGAVLGPKGLGALAHQLPGLGLITIVSDEGVHWLAELGIVFLLFFIGLELSLPRLMTMRKFVFGLGTAQVVLSAGVIGLAVAALGGRSAAASVLIGACLALSSTAMVIELLARQNRLTTLSGRASFSVLLLQDLAVVPMLFLAGILAAQSQGSITVGLLTALLQAALVIVVIVAAGRLLLRPLFRLVAQSGTEEMFVAATLFVAIGTGVITQAVGLSMALGAFVSGLLLAETEYRKAIEATVEPFKGLLLGVFFFSVGMMIDLRLLVQSPVPIIGAAIGLMVIKTSILIPLARLFGLAWPAAIETGLLLGPGGEFAFIIIGVAISHGIVDWATGSAILTVDALTMAMIPLMAALSHSAGRRLSVVVPVPHEDAAAPPQDLTVQAIIIGHGRVGRLLGEMLTRHGVTFLATERDPATAGRWRRGGRPVYFGDAKQASFLRRCGVERASAVIITIHSPSEIDEIVAAVRSLREDILIVSRARDAEHARHLYSIGVGDAVPETIEASLQLSEAALVGLGVPTGPVIASIHEKRDEFRQDLQQAAALYGLTTRAVRRKKLSGAA